MDDSQKLQYHQTAIEIIRRHTGVTEDRITISEDGFLSYGYIVDDGKYIFKFKKFPNVTYKNEIQLLNHLNRLNLGIRLQRVGWQSEDDQYLGLYGVCGRSLEKQRPQDRDEFGRQLGLFLKKLHAVTPKTDHIWHLTAEIEAWQKRYRKGKPLFEAHFTTEELAKMDRFMLREMPEELLRLGEDLVFSHADLGDGNIFIDENGEIGIIDFNESGYADRAADFMDIGDERICQAMLKSYGADEALRRKVALRRIARPLFITETYAQRQEHLPYILRIKAWLKGEPHV